MSAQPCWVLWEPCGDPTCPGLLVPVLVWWLWSPQSPSVTALGGMAGGCQPLQWEEGWQQPGLWFVLAVPLPCDVPMVVLINHLCFLPSFLPAGRGMSVLEGCLL